MTNNHCCVDLNHGTCWSVPTWKLVFCWVYVSHRFEPRRMVQYLWWICLSCWVTVLVHAWQWGNAWTALVVGYLSRPLCFTQSMCLVSHLHDFLHCNESYCSRAVTGQLAWQLVLQVKICKATPELWAYTLVLHVGDVLGDHRVPLRNVCHMVPPSFHPVHLHPVSERQHSASWSHAFFSRRHCIILLHFSEFRIPNTRQRCRLLQSRGFICPSTPAMACTSVCFHSRFVTSK